MNHGVQDVFKELSPHFKGTLLRPCDAAYGNVAPVWNGIFNRRPALVARCFDVNDVQMCVRVAATSEVVTAIRCGGHSLAGFGTCDDGLVIDLSSLREVHVDAHSRKACFGGGCLLGTVDAATQATGLAFPAGVVSHTGAGGLVLGGGTGWLNRLYGLSCDNVEAFTLVAADGLVHQANAKENSDLFWALRGGGGNFGIVTQFEVRLHPVTHVLLGNGLCVGENIFGLLQHWREFMPEAPNNLRWGFSLRIAGDGPGIPQEVRGAPVANSSVLWIGDHDGGLRHIDHALTAVEHKAIKVEEMSFLSLQTMADSDFPHGRRYYTKSGYFQVLGDDVIGLLIDALTTIPSGSSEIELTYLGGAVGRVPPEETAFGNRGAPFVLNILSNWTEPCEDAANIDWSRNLFSRLRPLMVHGVYVNFMSGDEEERVPEAYPGRWERLRNIKTKYDPRNVFHLNQNIPPHPAPVRN